MNAASTSTTSTLLSLAAFILACVVPLAPSPVRSGDETVRTAIREIVAAAEHPESKRRRFPDYGGSMERLYAPLDYAPAWFDNGAPRRQADEIVAALRTADRHGLDPGDYDAAWLEQRLHSHRASPFAGRELAELDTALSLALLRYLSDVHLGRVMPEQVHFHLDLAARQYDLPALVREAVAADRLGQLIAEAPPRVPMYRRLGEALARYRALAADATLAPVPVVKKLEPGMPYAGLEPLGRLLVAVGDLSPDVPPPTRYEGELVEAVKRFQARHGLDADGIIGRNTLAQLNTPMSRRLRQVELAMERMRWLPPVAADRLLAVNIPEFKLRALDLRGGAARVVLRMNVIVGKALDTQTPVFDEDMRYIEFNPYWNVPPSIARGEIVPKLRRDPGYLAREEMEFVGTENNVSSVVSEANLDAVLRGELRIRQRPGPKNALGDIKFVFPNNMNIYLHHTATPRLFQRGRRDFSHGCIRVEEPVALASFVLADQPEWTEERIREAMAGDTPRTVRLAQPIPVLVFYTTVIAEDDGRVLFLPDIYGHDGTLERALQPRDRIGR